MLKHSNWQALKQKSTLIVCICIVAMSGPQVAHAQRASISLVHECESCHGPGGNSTSDTVPRLNGQQAQYLRARLNNLRDPLQGTMHSIDAMFTNANSTPDMAISPLAHYFAAQPVTPSKPKGPEAPQGKRIFENGASNGVASCASCHGQEGEGGGGAPRLAGQHAAYLLERLHDFTAIMPASEIMDHQAYHLTEEQMKALVAYLGNG